MPGKLRILLLEDNPDDAELLIKDLRSAGFDPVWTRVDDEAGFRAGLLDRPDIIIVDYQLPQFDAESALPVAASIAPGVPVIVVSGVVNDAACAHCLRHGAVDYLLKDRLTRLGPAIHQALHHKQLEASWHQAERAAKDMAATLQNLVDGAPALIFLTDEQGRFVLVNSAFERFLGLDRRQLVGHCLQDLRPGDLAMTVTTANKDCLASKSPVEAEEELRIAGRRETLLSVRYPLRLTGGNHGVAAIYTNISKQKETELALREAQASLVTQADELAAANRHLQELDRLRSQFVATVSHELRTPLTSILGYAELLLAEPLLTPDAERMITIIDRNSQRLLNLINNLLLAAQIEQGSLELKPGSTEVADIVTECCAVFLPEARAAGLTLRHDVRPGLRPIRAQHDDIERVLLNLLSNAIKFSPHGGHVAVTATKDDRHGHVRLTVQDTGIGIPLPEQHRLFTRFFRSSASERLAIQGSGLGLSICKAIVEGYGGSIRVRSGPGPGTAVILTFPTTDDISQAEGPASPGLGRRSG